MRWRRRTRAPMPSAWFSGLVRRARSNSSRRARLRPRCRRSSRSSACSSIRSPPRCARPSTRCRSTSCNSTAMSRRRCARRSARPYIKAVPVRQDVDLLQYASRYRDARGLLFDAFVAGGMPGGTGRTLRLAGAGDAARRGTCATADSVRWAHAAQRRRRDPGIAPVGGRRIERRRDDRRRRQTAQRHQGPGEDRRVHPRSA